MLQLTRFMRKTTKKLHLICVCEKGEAVVADGSFFIIPVACIFWCVKMFHISTFIVVERRVSNNSFITDTGPEQKTSRRRATKITKATFGP